MDDDASATPSPIGVLKRAGVPYRVARHQAIRTQQDIEEHLDFPVEQSVKTLVFEAPDERIVLAVIPGPSRLSYRDLAEAVRVTRAQLRAAEPATLGLLGMEPGGASPVCDNDRAITVFDTAVAPMGSVYCGSGRADVTIEVDSQDLIRLARTAVVAPIAKKADQSLR